MNIAVVFSPELKDGILATSKRLINFERVIEKFRQLKVTHPDVDVEIERYAVKVHSERYVEKIKRLPFYLTAVESLKAVIKAVDLIKDYDLVLVPTSGTGYVVEKEKMRGYGIFNDVAVLVERLAEQGYEKIVVINTDAHHGNFALIGERAVCFCVLGKIKCSTIERFVCKPSREIPKEECIERLKKNVEDVEEYNPDVVVWYLGQDLHHLEYSEMEFDRECYSQIFKIMLKVAEKRKLIVIFASGSREDVFDEIMECFGQSLV